MQLLPSLRRLATCALLACALAHAAPSGPFNLDLPDDPVSDHLSITKSIGAGETADYGTFEGPGCLKRIWVTLSRPVGSGRTVAPDAKPSRAWQNRKIILRIYFDGSKTPNVEAPIGDFFGIMHGVDYYPVNTQFISVKEHNGYECYFDLPFAKSARIEITNAPDANNSVYLQVAWHRYPDQEMKEKRRFSAQWRREMPTPRYGNDYMILDADGPGQLIGFFYGVRLIDSVDRWSHGGAENLYIDGLGDQPAYIRGIGGEDTFATSYGGVLHRPESHLYDGIPYYVPEDTGEARSAQRLVGYRFYVADSIKFKKSLRFQFGSMENDIASMVYWYQEGTPRRFVKMPEWGKMLPGAELKAGQMDLALPDDGSWNLGPVLENEDSAALRAAMKPGAAKSEPAAGTWTKQPTIHGFVDFNHLHRPGTRGVGTHHRKKAAEAVTTIEAPSDMTAKIRIAWDGRLVLRVNDVATEFGNNSAFRQRTVEVPLKKGPNRVSVTLSNDTGTNHGGWAFAFRATTPDGAILVPRADGK
ncbi:MAG: glycoside hydrolase family 172 protein [Verrucomicrobiota bacterium]